MIRNWPGSKDLAVKNKDDDKADGETEDDEAADNETANAGKADGEAAGEEDEEESTKYFLLKFLESKQDEDDTCYLLSIFPSSVFSFCCVASK